MGGTESSHAERRGQFGVRQAIDLAENAHRGATDKAGEPYIQHVKRVVGTVETDAEKMTAALHDVIEDTPTTLDNLTGAGCPTQVVAAVDALTRRGGESYESFLERVAQNELARRVKVADLMDNSDESRLALLAPEEAEPLRAKYRRAIESLGATQEIARWSEERRLEDRVFAFVLHRTQPIDEIARYAAVKAEFPCDRCPRLAGRLMRVGRHVLVVDFMGRAAIPINRHPRSRGARNRAAFDAAVAARNARALDAINIEYVPWWCPYCGRNYCDRHWQMEARYEDGFYDCTYGTCPKGHRRLLDD